MDNKTTKKAYLVLEDGTIIEGKSFGAEGTAIGEIVYTTGVIGYQENLTDPSFYGQVIVQTFPLIGNYGVNSYSFESEKAWAKGYVVREWCENPSNFRNEKTIDAFLKEQNVVGLCGIDTRALTKKIRNGGAMNCAITTQLPDDIGLLLKDIKEYKIVGAVEAVGSKEIKVIGNDDVEYTVVMYECGCKNSMIDDLSKLGCKIISVPYDTDINKALSYNPDGIILSDGPGSPEDEKNAIALAKELLKGSLPLFGVGLGHQIMAISGGAVLTKMKCGHRGENQPVKDVNIDRVFITVQNHGYTIKSETVTDNIGKISHVNVNDGDCEGIEYNSGKAFSVQFDPKVHADSKSANYLLEKFLKLMK